VKAAHRRALIGNAPGTAGVSGPGAAFAPGRRTRLVLDLSGTLDTLAGGCYRLTIPPPFGHGPVMSRTLRAGARGRRGWGGPAASCSGLVVAFWLLLSCAGSPSSPSAGSPAAPSVANPEQLTEKLVTPHFRVLADRTETAVLTAVADALEAAYPRMTAELQSGDLPVVSAWVWSDAASFYEAMVRNVGGSVAGATGYVFGSRDLALLTNSAVARNASHELAHIVSLAVNPRLGNNPRWLWETVALYENREFVAPMTLDYIRAGRYPTLAQLSADPGSSRQVYELGYVLGEFIVATWRTDGLVRLVRSNGDIPATFGISVAEFEARWYADLRARYGTP